MSPDAPAKIRLIGLIAGGYSGVPRYAALLTRSLGRVVNEFPTLQLTLITTTRGAREVGENRNIEVSVPRGLAARANAGPSRLLVEQLLAARGEVDLLYFFDVTGPLLAPSRPFVATAHDARPVYDFQRRRWAYKRRLFPWALKRARGVVAVSQYAKDEIVRHFGTDATKIRVVHSGPGLDLPSSKDTGRLASVRPYLLYLGRLNADKNLTFLIEAFEHANVPVDLVLAGRPQSNFEALVARIERSPVRSRIRVAQEVSDRDADRLYRDALALVHPSIYEGFGFTPLEAMARNCPVLASDIPAIQEVSGSGAMLLPLEDVSAWSEGIRRVATDERLRAELRERGSVIVSRYSWDKTARGVCRFLVEVTAALRLERAGGSGSR